MLIKTNIEVILRALLVISLGVLTLPLMPEMPSTNLDPSWMMGMVQALIQGERIGQDIVFTFGPYSFLYTKAYHPTLTNLTWSISVLFTTAYTLVCWQLFAHIQRFWLLLILVLFAFLVQSQDTVFLAYPLLFGVWLWQKVTIHSHADNTWKMNSLLVFLASTMGLLVLVKGSFAIAIIGTLVLCSGLLLYRRRYLSFLLLCIAPIVACIGFWLLVQPSLTNLVLYFSSMFEISRGYTEAMAIRHEIHDAILFTAASSGLLIYLIYKTKANKATQLFLGLLFSYVLFLSFKAGLVRNDVHSIIAGNILWLSAVIIFAITHPQPHVLLIVVRKSKWLKALCAVIFLALLSIQARYVVASIIFPQIKYDFPILELGHFLTRTLSNQSLKNQYQQRLSAIAQQHPLPTLDGTSDIYEHQQAFLLVSNNVWNPRPVFQSYSAYTPKLARINQAHLLSKQAPDHIFFNVEPIDNRYPSLNDGLSWPVLLQNYQPSTTTAQGFLILDRVASAAFVSPITLGEHQAILGELVNVPITPSRVFIELNIQPTLLGKIAAVLYKTAQLNIEVELYDGQIKQHRIIANMAQTGFVLSPYVASRDDFAALYLNDKKLPRVRSFKVVPYNASWLWHPGYQVVFKQI